MVDLREHALFSLLHSYEATHGLTALTIIRETEKDKLSPYQAGIKEKNKMAVDAFLAAGERGINYLNDILVGNFSDGHAECAAHILEELADQIDIPVQIRQRLRERADKSAISTAEYRINFAAKSIEKKMIAREIQYEQEGFSRKRKELSEILTEDQIRIQAFTIDKALDYAGRKGKYTGNTFINNLRTSRPDNSSATVVEANYLKVYGFDVSNRTLLKEYFNTVDEEMHTGLHSNRLHHECDEIFIKAGIDGENKFGYILTENKD